MGFQLKFRKYNSCKSNVKFCLIFGLCLNLFKCSSTNGQVLNSLATFFRARPPWPTAFPTTNQKTQVSNSFQFPLNSLTQNLNPLLSSGTSHQGILIAHPIKTNFNNYQNTHYQIQPNPIFSPPQTVTSFLSSHAIPNLNAFKPAATGNVHLASLQPTTTSPPFLSNINHNNLLEDHGGVTDVYTFDSSDLINLPIPPSTTKPLDFRPSPQILDPLQQFNLFHNSEGADNPSAFQALESNVHPKYESGFQPITHNQYSWNYGSLTGKERYANSHQQYHHASRSPSTTTNSTKSKNSTSPVKKDRKIVNAKVSKSVVTTEMSVESSSSSSKKGRTRNDSKEKNSSSSTSSSELVEDWIKVEQPKNIFEQTATSKQKFPVYRSKLRFLRPAKCEFHRFGFCSVDSHYPKSDVEKVASRCYNLLTHIIAPQLNYSTALAHNGTIRERSSPVKRPNQRGWNWKTYQGKPLCDTLELKVAPGWAKDELGDWAVILQTPEWKQEAQVSICATSHTEYVGFPCSKKSSAEFYRRTRCVQRFSSQRLAVLDPENQDRCPIVKSVFLPSACISISDTVNASTFASEQFDHMIASGSENIEQTISATSVNDTTFMIVTEKISFNESTSESPSG